MYMSSHPRHPVIVASNRGPVSFGIGDDGTLTARRGGGGMVSGLSSALAANGTSSAPDPHGAHSSGGTALWVCTAMSDADRAAARHGVVAAGESPGDVPVLM